MYVFAAQERLATEHCVCCTGRAPLLRLADESAIAAELAARRRQDQHRGPDPLPAHYGLGMLYITMTTRPDVSYAVGMLTCYLAFPTNELLKKAEREQHGRRTCFLQLGPDCTHGPVTDGDSDASFEAGRSTSGYSFMLFDAAIAWGMKKQQSIASSTGEAEIMAGSLAACDLAVYLRGLLTKLGFPQPPGPTWLIMDNSGAFNLAHDPVSHAKSKHVHLPEYVNDANNTADILTKPVGRVAFQKHSATLLGLRNKAENLGWAYHFGNSFGY
eukprot:6187900-Pleurochrysis_carterae.AAC.2